MTTTGGGPRPGEILDAIRLLARNKGRAPSRTEFLAGSRIKIHWVLEHFGNWGEAVSAAGLKPNPFSKKLEPDTLLADWGQVVRALHRIPTRSQYEREGGTFTVDPYNKAFGPWASLPSHFRQFAASNSGWDDVLALLPTESSTPTAVPREVHSTDLQRSTKLRGRPTYGNPIDFRGLRHEPVNEQGVVFLFGMVAHEIGYHVEAVQTGFPDCEAKRQITNGTWQRVRIEFEFESRNFREHGHPPEGCDVIVCWRHNWTECPSNLEVVTLETVIRTLASSDE